MSPATPVTARVGPFDAHTRAEAALADSLSHTILRPSLYAQAVFSEHGPLGLPSGAGAGQHVLADAPVAYVSAVVAAVTARALVSDDVSRNANSGPHGASGDSDFDVYQRRAVLSSPVRRRCRRTFAGLASDLATVWERGDCLAKNPGRLRFLREGARSARSTAARTAHRL